MPNPIEEGLEVFAAHRKGVFDDPVGFEAYKKMAECLNESTMVPIHYQGQEKLSNCMIALDLSARIGLSPLMVMQNLDVVYGVPTWSGKMALALVNSSGLFRDPIEFEWKGEKGKDEWGCRCIATMKGTGTKVQGPWVDIALAKAEGWYDRKDSQGRFCSKWRTLAELMLRYRAGSYFGKTICPQVLLGLGTREEQEDIGPQLPPGPSIDINATPSLGNGNDLARGSTGAPPPAALDVGRPVVVPPVGLPTREQAEAAEAMVRRNMGKKPAPPPQRIEIAQELPMQPALAAVAASQPTADWIATLDFALQNNGITVDDFMTWLHSTGYDKRFNVDTSDVDKIPDLDSLPVPLVEAVLADPKGMGACAKQYGKKPR